MSIVRRGARTAMHCSALVVISALTGCAAEIDGNANLQLDAGAGSGGKQGSGDRAGAGAGQGGARSGAGRGGSSGSTGMAGRMASAGAGGTGRAGSSAQSGSGAAGQSGAAGMAGMAGMAGTMEEPPGVRFIGRTDRRQANVVRMAWSGSGDPVSLRGQRSLHHARRPRRLLHAARRRHAAAARSPRARASANYQLARDLPDGTHTVELYRRTEASFGETRFLGVDLGDGELLAPPPPAQRRIEIIGDSITCGYGNEGPTATARSRPRTENHYLTYGAISARDLDADLITVAWSGKGIIYNYDEDKNQPMPELYPRTLPGDAQSRWDFSEWQPHVVVINLGTNDFSTGNDPPESVFGPAYTDLLTALRDEYPDALIVCLVPTLARRRRSTTAEDYITRVGDAPRRRRACVVSRARRSRRTGSGCDGHPSLATHASMADALTAELKQILGW